MGLYFRMDDDSDRTASLMTPAKLAQLRMKPKPAGSPASLLDQMAADAGAGHVRRVVDLRRQLEAQAREHDYQGVRSALAALDEVAATLDFTLLQPKGWLARATGKGKSEAEGFSAAARRIASRLEDFKEEVHALRKNHQTQSLAMERTLAEFESEIKSIERILDQGARWLQDMRNQLRVRQSQSPDAEARKLIDQDNARCELLVERMKQLRGANSAAHHADELCRTAIGRRTSFLQALQQAIEQEFQAWSEQVEPLSADPAKAAAAGAADDARAAHQQFVAGVQEAKRHAEQAKRQSQDLVEELAVLAKPLDAAA